MKRTLLLRQSSSIPLVSAATGLIGATYGLIRLAYGLFLPDIQEDLTLGVATAGWISSGASTVYCLGALLGFVAAVRHARALVIAAALSAGAGAFGMAASPDVGSFAVFAIASSAGAGLASPALVAVLQCNRSTRDRPSAQAIVNAGTGPGLIAAGALALILLPDWRLAWAIAGTFTVAVAGLVVVVDRKEARVDADPDLAPGRDVLPPASWFTAQWRLVVAALLMGSGSAAVWNYGRTLLVESGSDEVVSVTAWIALGVGGTAVIATARLVERLGPGIAWIAAVSGIALGTAALAIAPRVAWLALAACVTFGWGYMAATGALIVWTAQIDSLRAPAGTALLFITLILGQAVGATAFGLLIPATTHATAFIAAAMISLFAVAPALWRKAEATAVRQGTV